MSIKVSLEDNSIQSLSVEFIQLSPSFKVDETSHIHVNLAVFEKIKAFGDKYLELTKNQKKLLDNPETVWEKENDMREWCETFLELESSDLIDLTNIAHKLGIKPLLDLCCYHIAQLVKDKSVEQLRKLFKIENDFQPEEEELLKNELCW